jgi:oxygen-independent coproporphyrinogen-3 oxidase
MIYVHVPFCRSFCTYCDFYSEVCGGCCDQPQREAALFERYTDDLCAEIRARRDEILAASGVRTLYIGGGTPSVLPLDCLRRIVEKLREVEGYWEEFTVEVNPEDIVERGPSYVEGLL